MEMPNYKQYGEAMYDQQAQKPVAHVPFHPESNYDLQPSERNPLLLLGMGLAGGALIGAAILFIVMPKYNTIVEKKVDEPVVVSQTVPPQPTPTVIAPPTAAVAVVAPPPAPKVEMVAPVVVTSPPPAPPLVVETPKRPLVSLPRAEITNLIGKAKAAINEGDISLARTYLQRAANANDGGALLMMGETYDPNVLKNWGVRGIKPDVERAKEFYNKAEFMGESDARLRLRDLR